MSKTKAIIDLYQRLSEEGTNSKEYHKILSEFCDSKDEFDKGIIEEQKNQLDKLLDLQTDMNEVNTKEFFVKGFALATKLITEVFYTDYTRN